MNNKTSLLLVLLVPALVLLSGCETDFDVNAPYEERAAIYSVFESDTAPRVQQARVQKVFLTETNAQEAAKINSTSEYDTSEIQVVMVSGNQEFIMRPVIRDTKDTTGDFFGGQHVIYETDAIRWDLSKSYGIKVTNKKTGYEAASDEQLQPVRLVTLPPRELLDIYADNEIRIPNPFADGVGYYQLVGQIVYYERANNTDGPDQRINWQVTSATELKSNNIAIDFKSDAFISAVISGINNSNDPSDLERRIRRVEMTLTATSKQIPEYQRASNNFSVVSQTAPFYTNINNGLGVFGTRRQEKYTAIVTGSVLRQLKEDYPDYKFQ